MELQATVAEFQAQLDVQSQIHADELDEIRNGKMTHSATESDLFDEATRTEFAADEQKLQTLLRLKDRLSRVESERDRYRERYESMKREYSLACSPSPIETQYHQKIQLQELSIANEKLRHQVENLVRQTNVGEKDIEGCEFNKNTV